MNHGSYTWKITNKQAIYKLIHASVGESFESDPFEIAQLQWTMILYPNGWNKKNKGCFNVCIKLLTMSSKWRQLILCRTIQCLETLSSCTSIASYYKNGDTMCWKERTLLLSELFHQQKPAINALSFKASIHILRIISKKSKQIIYPNVSDGTTPSYDYKQQQYIVWKIDNETLTKFRCAYHSKSFESKKYHNKMWCLRSYPQGIGPHDEGYFGLYLTLCHLPPNISKMKVLYTFRCKELKNVKHSRIKTFSYNDKSSWGVSRFFDVKKLHKLRQLTIYVDITIMNEYDEDGKEILPLIMKLSPEGYKSPIKSNILSIETEEEKVNAMELDTDSVAVFCSSSISSTIDNKYKRYSSGNITHKKSQNQVINAMRKEVTKEIEQLQTAYNIKLNSLCAIVEQIQINNDTLSSQTREMMKTVNDVCDLMQKERSKMKNTSQRNDIERLKEEMHDIQEYLMQQTKLNNNENNNHNNSLNSAPLTLYFDDEMKEEYETDENEENEVRSWLTKEVKMPCYIDNFLRNGFDDLSVIKEMTMDELLVIGINKLGHRMKILQFIRKIYPHYKPMSITDSSISWSHRKLSVVHKKGAGNVTNVRSNSLESSNKMHRNNHGNNSSAAAAGAHSSRRFKRNLSVNSMQNMQRTQRQREKSMIDDAIPTKLYTEAIFIESPSSHTHTRT